MKGRKGREGEGRVCQIGAGGGEGRKGREGEGRGGEGGFRA